jgi:hypothetical protein
VEYATSQCCHLGASNGTIYPLLHVISKLDVIQNFLFNADKFIETSMISAFREVSKLREIGDRPTTRLLTNAMVAVPAAS